MSQSANKHADLIALGSPQQPRDLIPLDSPRRVKQDLSECNYFQWNHSQLQYASEVLACERKTRGLRKGQRIATLLYNVAEWAICAPAAPRQTARDWDYQGVSCISLNLATNTYSGHACCGNS